MTILTPVLQDLHDLDFEGALSMARATVKGLSPSQFLSFESQCIL